MDEKDDGLHVHAPTLEDFVRLCRSLNETSARYVLISGFAVITHGGGRTIKDIDFLIASTRELRRIEAVLRHPVRDVTT